MSSTATFHVACDSCGKREDVVQQHPNQSVMPDGWINFYGGGVVGEFCSEPCLRQKLVAAALERAIRAFEPAEVPA